MTVSELMKRPYHVVIVRDEDPNGDVAWVAGVMELPGCLSHGDTPGEAAERIQEAMELWLEGVTEDGFEIPEPNDYEFPIFPLKRAEAHAVAS